MRVMWERHIPAVPTFAIFEYFAQHASRLGQVAQESAVLSYKVEQVRRQIAGGISFAIGSGVGPFLRGTQAREPEWMVRYGLSPLATRRAEMLNGARLLGWAGEIGALKAGYYADIIAVPGNPLEDIANLQHVAFVMKSGLVIRSPDSPDLRT